MIVKEFENLRKNFKQVGGSTGMRKRSSCPGPNGLTSGRHGWNVFNMNSTILDVVVCEYLAFFKT